MEKTQLQQPITIMGIVLRTTNDNGQAFTEIPPFWGKFISEQYAEKIPHKLNNDVYGVYTHFENEGKNNQGLYSLIIGCAVSSTAIPPEGFTVVTIPAGHYHVFPVEKGRQDKVCEVWQDIWAIPVSQKKSWRFQCEFERYQASGEIDIFIGC